MDYTAIFTLCLVIITWYVASRQIKAMNSVSQVAIASQKEITKLNLTMQLVDKYDSDTIRAKRRGLANHLIQNRKSANKHDTETGIYVVGVEYVVDILETIGALHQRGWLDNQLIYNSFSYPAMQWWYALEDYIAEARKSGITEYYDKFQYLAETFIKLELANNPITEENKQKEIDDFLQSEVT